MGSGCSSSKGKNSNVKNPTMIDDSSAEINAVVQDASLLNININNDPNLQNFIKDQSFTPRKYNPTPGNTVSASKKDEFTQEDLEFTNQLADFIGSNDAEVKPLPQKDVLEVRKKQIMEEKNNEPIPIDQDYKKVEAVAETRKNLAGFKETEFLLDGFSIAGVMSSTEELKVFDCTLQAPDIGLKAYMLRLYESKLHTDDQKKVCMLEEAGFRPESLQVFKCGNFAQPGIQSRYIIFCEKPLCSLKSAIVHLSKNQVVIQEDDVILVIWQLVKAIQSNQFNYDCKYLSDSHVHIRTDMKTVCIGDYDTNHFFQQAISSINVADVENTSSSSLDPHQEEAIVCSAPEIFKSLHHKVALSFGKPHSHLIYSLGVIALKFALLIPHLTVSMKNQFPFMIATLREKKMNLLAELIEGMIDPSPSSRITYQTILEKIALVNPLSFSFTIKTPIIPDLPNDRANLLKLGISYGKVYHLLCKFKEALNEYQKALKVLDMQQNVSNYERIQEANCYNHMGNCYRDLGQTEIAITYLEKALDYKKKLLGVDHPSYVSTLNNIALLYKEKGYIEKAVQATEHTTNTLGRIYGEGHPAYLRALDNHVEILIALRDFETAHKLSQQAIELRKKYSGPGSMEYAQSLGTQALILKELGEYDRGLEEGMKSKEIFEQQDAIYSIDYIELLVRLAEIYKLQENLEKASELYEKVFTMSMVLDQVDDNEFLDILDALAEHYRDTSNYDKAIQSYERIISVKTNVADSIPYLNKVSVVHENKGDFTRALEIQRQIAQFKAQTFGEQSLEYALTLQMMGSIYESSGQLDQALGVHLECVKIKHGVVGNTHKDYYRSVEAVVRLARKLGNSEIMNQYTNILRERDERSLKTKMNFFK